jgi:HAD superfamily hydrolase (TIGR01490 family)
MVIAIFDLDGTLYTGHIGRGIAEHHQIHRTKRSLLYLYLVAHYPLWFLQKAGLLSDGVVRSIWARDMGWLVRGWTEGEAEVAFNWITEYYVLPRLRQNVVARMQRHREAGQRVILLSGTPTPLLEAIGHQLGIQEVVGTPLIMHNGRYTGGSELPVCQGMNKVVRLEEHLNSIDEIDWTESWAYADSYTDLHVLQRVGHPVAVYPDPLLAEHPLTSIAPINEDMETHPVIIAALGRFTCLILQNVI